MLGFAPASSFALGSLPADPIPEASAIALDAGPLRSSAVLAAAAVTAGASCAGPLSTPSATVTVQPVALCSEAGPLFPVHVTGFHDFTGLLGDSITHYVMDLDTPDGAVRVPISSWQATLQTGASCYVQCVIPAVADWTDAINAATAFAISRRAAVPDGAAIEYEMASAPVQTIALSRGPTNFTATISGYTDAFAEDDDPPAATDRTLAGVRSTSTTAGKIRARCSIDWTLRPAQRAIMPDASSFIVGYINYYKPGGNDEYMDVGE